jgi:hypothetical protein
MNTSNKTPFKWNKNIIIIIIIPLLSNCATTVYLYIVYSIIYLEAGLLFFKLI